MNNLIKFEIGTTISEASEILGINKWSAKKENCRDKNGLIIPDVYYLANSETSQVISTKPVGKVYTESSHNDMIEFFGAIIENNPNIKLDNGFVVNNGTNIIIQANWNKVLEVTENQIINPVLTYIIDHSGLKANKIAQISKCLWCSNQLSLLVSNLRNKGLTIKHYKNQSSLINAAAKTYETLEKELEENLALYRVWSKTYISKDTFDQLVNALLDCHDAKTEKMRIYQQLEEKFYYGDGNSGKTLWDFVNSVTEQLRDVNYRDIQSKVKSELLGGAYKRSLKAALLAKNFVSVGIR